MIVERHSIAGHTGEGGKLSNFIELFDTLCEWDNRVEDENSVTYSYGGADIKISLISSDINIKITIGTYSSAMTSTSSSNSRYINFLIVKTTSSIGITADAGTQNGSVLTGAAFNNQLRFVLTKCMNLNTGAEERGIVLHYSTGYNSYVYTIVSSENNIVSASTETKNNNNSAATILYPACCFSYSGYCPHVFFPLFQNCGYTSGKCTVGASDYYILGGTMYLLDD